MVDGRPTLDLWTGDLDARGRLLEALDGPAVERVLETAGFLTLAGFQCCALRNEKGNARSLLVLGAPAAELPPNALTWAPSGERRRAGPGRPGSPAAGAGTHPARPGAGS